MIYLDKLYEKQFDLDKEIFQKHNIDYPSTVYSRTVALLVEIGEFANETRAFKFWSNKPSSEKSIVIEEYVDALHFFLSLGLSDGFKLDNMEGENEPGKLNEQLLTLYQKVLTYSLNRTKENYDLAFTYFLNLGHSVGFSDEDIMEAYMKKLNINYKRQENNY